jgi:hypothetical protein
MQYILDSHTAELTEEELEELSPFSNHKTKKILKPLCRGLQMADDLVNHVSEVDHFMVRCLKFNCDMKATTAQ